MGLFKKRNSEAEAADPHLGLLPVSGADRLRSLTRTVLAENGFEAEVFGDHVRTPAGGVYGLDNLMRRVRAADDREWDSIVRAHFAVMLRPADDELKDEDLRERIIVRLWDATTADPNASLNYALEWQPGLAELLAIDKPDRVEMIGDSKAGSLAPLGPWYDRARRNLLRELSGTAVAVEAVEHDGHSIRCAMSDSVYTATGVVLLPEVLRQWCPDIDLSEGVLFAAPFRHQVAFAECADARSALGGLMLLPMFAASGYEGGVGPLSPNVYYWRDGRVTQVSSLTEDGNLAVTPPDEVVEILNRGL